VSSPLYYFDHAASAPRRDEVAEAMEPYLHGVVGNPSGSHQAARAARRALEDARDEVAAFMGFAPDEVVFTAGGTESCELALSGVVRHHRRTHERSRLVVSAIEHHAVLDAAASLARDFDDVEVVEVGVDDEGQLDLEALARALTPDVALVSVMTANNETGVCQPVGGVTSVVAGTIPGGSLVHSDAVAAAPWLHLPTVTATCDLVSICAHKIGGPVNAGALGVRNGVEIDAVAPGGGQERGRRGGTSDVAAAVGLAAACRATNRERVEGYENASELQARLDAALALLPRARVTSRHAPRLPGTVHVTFEGLASDEILFLLDRAGVCASAAASCSSGAAAPSHVLAAMGVAPERARGALRLSMGPETTSSEVDAVIAALAEVVHRLDRGA
jgi:cysteine desulfurase